MTQRAPLVTHWGPLAALAALAFLLRRYHLGYQSLWFDEADIVMRAQVPLGELLSSLLRPGENGPLYTLLLHLWIAVFGDAETRVRMLSVAFGVLLVPAVYFLAEKFSDRRAGLIAALLLAISPFQIWQSQEAKMYSMATLLAATSTLVLMAWKYLGKLTWSYPILMIGAILSHMLCILLLPFHLLAHAAGRIGRRLPIAITTVILVVFVGILLMAAALGDTGSHPYRPVGVLEMLQVMAKTFSVNRADPTTELTGAVSSAVLALVGIVALTLSRRQQGLLLAAFLFVPLAPFIVINRTVGLFEERYLFVTFPPYLVAVSVGIAWLWSRRWVVGLMPLVLLVGLSGIALQEVNYSDAPNRENWREAVRYVAEHFRDEDAVAVQPGYLVTAVNYYAKRYPDLAGVRVITPPSMNRPDVTERYMEAVLTQGTIGKERVWLFYDENRSSLEDPRARVWEWFHYNWFTTYQEPYVGFKLYNYSFNGPYKVAAPWPQVRLRISYLNGWSLIGLDYGTPLRTPEVAPGGLLPLTLRWLITEAPITSPRAILKLVGSDGHTAVVQEGLPLNGNLELSRLRKGSDLWDYRDLEIPRELSPGRYDLYIEVLDSYGVPIEAFLSGGLKSMDVALDSIWVR